MYLIISMCGYFVSYVLLANLIIQAFLLYYRIHNYTLQNR